MGEIGVDFEILHLLGTGWSAKTWAAKTLNPIYNRDAGLHLAIKRYKPSIFEDFPHLEERIAREAQLVQGVDDENLVRIFELRKFEIPGSARDWALIMELCRCGDLSKFIKENWPLCGVKLLNIATGVAKGLVSLHYRDIVHRDIKPQNIFLSDSLTPKIGDFGVVNDLDEATMTGSSEFLGTIRYAAPESLEGGEVGKFSDMYSFGTVLFELLYGSRPYDNTELFSKLVANVLEAPAVIPDSLDRFGQDPKLEHFVVEALCKRLLRRDISNRLTAPEAHNALVQTSQSNVFSSELRDKLFDLLCEHSLAWRKEARLPEMLLRKYGAWTLSEALSEADAVEVLKGNGQHAIENKKKYLNVVCKYPPRGEEYAKLPIVGRRILSEDLVEIADNYVHQVWDDTAIKSQRHRSVTSFAKDVLEFEGDKAIRENWQKVIDIYLYLGD